MFDATYGGCWYVTLHYVALMPEESSQTKAFRKAHTILIDIVVVGFVKNQVFDLP
jgi:hypothetical protein